MWGLSPRNHGEAENVPGCKAGLLGLRALRRFGGGGGLSIRPNLQLPSASQVKGRLRGGSVYIGVGSSQKNQKASALFL